jgi:hypothetical protein
MPNPTTKRLLVHAVVYMDGRIAPQSVITIHPDNSFCIDAYRAETEAVIFVNGIAVVASEQYSETIADVAKHCKSITELITVEQQILLAQATVVDDLRCYIVKCD